MSESEIEQLKLSLLDKDQMNMEYLEVYSDILRDHRLLRHITGDKIDEIESYFSDLPSGVGYAIEASIYALIKTMVKNNQRIHRLLELSVGKTV